MSTTIPPSTQLLPHTNTPTQGRKIFTRPEGITQLFDSMAFILVASAAGIIVDVVAVVVGGVNALVGITTI